MTDNSFSKVDKYDGYVIGPNGELLGPYTNQTHSSENGYANASNAGVSWYADLKGYIGVQPTKLYGRAHSNLLQNQQLPAVQQLCMVTMFTQKQN